MHLGTCASSGVLGVAVGGLIVPWLGCALGSRLQGLVPMSAPWPLTSDTLYLPGIHEAPSGPFSQTSPPSLAPSLGTCHSRHGAGTRLGTRWRSSRAARF